MAKRMRKDEDRCVGIGVSLTPEHLSYLRSFECSLSDAVRKVIILAQQQQAHLRSMKAGNGAEG